MVKYVGPGFGEEKVKEANTPIELYIMFLPHDLTLYLTSYPEEVEFFDEDGHSGQTFEPYGIERQRVESHLTSEYDRVRVTFDNILREMSLYVNSRFLKGNRLLIWKVFKDRLESFDDKIVMYDGIMDHPVIDQYTMQVTVISKLERLEEELPRRLYTYNCPWTFGDSDTCGVSVPVITGTVEEVSPDGLTINSSAIEQETDYWRYGEITIADEARFVRHSGNHEVEVDMYFFSTVEGLEFELRAGCSRVYGDSDFGCDRWNNQDYFGGFRSVPNESVRV